MTKIIKSRIIKSKIIKYCGIAALISSLSSAALAVNQGPYLQLQGGQTNTHNPNLTVETGTIPATTTATASSTGYGGRISFGYNFNPYAAWETGFTYYAPPSYTSTPPPSCTPKPNQGSYDILGKGMFTIPQVNLGGYVKGGLAYVYRQSSCSTSKEKALRPAAAIGVSYDITQNWVVDLSLMRVFQGGGIQNADLLALGISYHFVNVYCGQFLC